MTLRLRRRRLITATLKKTAPYTGASGGIYRLEFVESSALPGLLLPPQRRVTRTAAGVRLAVTWAFIPQAASAAAEMDHLYFPGDPRTYVITAIKKYPRHLAFNLELKQ